MSDHNSVIESTAAPLSSPGLVWGLAGVTAFSFTVPFTRIAVDEGLSALFIGAGRAVVAGLLAAAVLAVSRQRRPSARQWGRLAVVAAGVVAGFPLLTSYALTMTPASHGAVVIGLLPAATAAVAVVRGGERVRTSFWVFTLLGAVAVLAFVVVRDGDLQPPHPADALLVGAVLAAAVGYTEGGLLARQLGSWQTVSWALVLALPLMVLLTAASLADGVPHARPAAWSAFVYLAVVSMYLGFFAWYRGLAHGPMAQVSQIQLAQPVMTILWAALLLGERLTWPIAIGGVAVITCAGLAVRRRLIDPARA